jgi:sugar lactone lactonase YvrE
MVVDDQGRTYVASTLGIQVLDPLGRVNLILNKPSYTPVSGLVIGGPLRDMLYVTDGQNVYARKLKIKGVDSYTAPVSLPKPRL